MLVLCQNGCTSRQTLSPPGRHIIIVDCAINRVDLPDLLHRQTCILSILLYGLETWTLLQEDLRKLEVFHMRSQRMILGIRWHDFVRNTEVVDRTGLPCVRDVIATRRNSFFGHVVRLDDHTPAHRALSQVAAARTGPCFGPGWRRRPGRPRHSADR